MQRMMRFEGLSANEAAVKETVQQLIEVRKNNMALLFGQTRIIQADDQILAFTREYFDQKELIVFNKDPEKPVSLTYNLKIGPDGVESEFGSVVNESANGLSVELKPLRFDIINY